MRATERAAFASGVFARADGKFDLRALFGDALSFCVEQDLYAVLLHDGEDFRGDIGVFAAQQKPGPLHNCHAAAKAAEELAKFQADVTAADNEKMFRNGVEFHDGSAVEIRNALQPFERRHGRAAAGVDEKFVGSESALRAVLQADLNGARAGEAGFAEKKIEIGSFFDMGLVAIAEVVDDVALALPNAAQINRDAAGVNAVIRAASREVGDAPACDHRLGGSATLVDASAANVCALHESRPQTCIGKSLAKRRSGLAGTNNDGLIVVRCAHEWSSVSWLSTPANDWMHNS